MSVIRTNRGVPLRALFLSVSLRLLNAGNVDKAEPVCVPRSEAMETRNEGDIPGLGQKPRLFANSQRQPSPNASSSSVKTRIIHTVASKTRVVV